MVDIVVHRERQLGIGAVDRGRRRKQQVPAAMMPASLQNVGEAGQIGVDIGVRVLQRIPDAGLGCEVNHHRKAMLPEQRLDRRPIGKVTPLEMKSGIMAENIEPGRLQPWVIVAVEIVEPNNAPTHLEQTLCHVKSDEAGRSRDQYRLI